MVVTFCGVSVYYRFYNRKTEVVDVFLHGWGCTHESLLFCKNVSKNSALFIDFPPFGRSDKNPKNFSIFTYANLVIWLCEKLKIEKINLIGHSFGGRVSLILAVLCKKNVQKLVLVDSAGLKPRRSLKYYFRIFTYKIRKKLGLDVSKFGSSDFLALDENMRAVFKSVISTHLDDFLPFVEAKTLIIFGRNDKTTPLYMAKKFKKRIKNSQLVILEDAGHFCFLDRKLEFSRILSDFLALI